MVIISRYHKKCRIAYLKVALITIGLFALFAPTIRPYKSMGYNIFTVMVNDKAMGTVDSRDIGEKLLNEARRKVAGKSDGIILIEAEHALIGDEILRGVTDDPSTVLANIIKEYEASVKETMKRSYTVKIDKYMVNLASTDDVVKLLEASLRKYDTEGKFSIEISEDENRELPVSKPNIVRTVIQEQEEEPKQTSDYLGDDGFFKAFDDVYYNVSIEQEADFKDYEYGIVNISFPNTVEVVESYLPTSQVTTLEVAIDEVTKDKEQKKMYEVVSGDTLSKISQKTGISVEDLIDLNDSLESARSTIRVGDELVITVPQPELSVARDELIYYEGTYEAPTEYIYNDSWYTTTEVTRQDPSSGYHKAVEKISYLNSEIVSKEVVMEEVVAEAIPKIVEKGTKVPPTYIKPISGGRITSGFGYRTATIRGMTSNHGAIDWGTPIGTTVVASCGGTVVHAGWMSSYGYCVFINHPDGKQTRYAHLSKVLVSKGQTVVQGQKIAYSGNTGVSTGPHLHFEMRINNTPVNPLNYLSY